MIKARNVSVKISGKTIIGGVDLQASAGQFTAIVGPNGSGKTTLLRALTSELSCDGKIAINGHSIRDLNAFEQAEIRGVLPQSSAVSFPFTVREIIQLGGAAREYSNSLNGQRCLIEEVLQRVGLEEFAARRYNELSGGQQQRVQLARVLFRIGSPVANDVPRWLFLDEPVASLDIRHQLQIMQIAADFARDGGGVIAVMHDLNLTAVFADQILMMKSGKIVAKGKPTSVLNSEVVTNTFDCNIAVNSPPSDGTPFILPHAAKV